MQLALPWLNEEGGLQDIEPYLHIIRNREYGHVCVTLIAQSRRQEE